ncbi:MAG: hypothetical protein WBB07_00875 [Mycobacterium sp.]
MVRFPQIVFGLTIPVNIVVILWVWLGRGFFDVTLGWIFAFFVFTALPVMVVALTLTTVLMFNQPNRRLTAGQAWLQTMLWLALILLGATIVDVDDASYEESILINLVGFSYDSLRLSTDLQAVFGLISIALWALLVCALAMGIRRQSARRPGGPS